MKPLLGIQTLFSIPAGGGFVKGGEAAQGPDGGKGHQQAGPHAQRHNHPDVGLKGIEQQAVQGLPQEAWHKWK